MAVNMDLWADLWILAQVPYSEYLLMTEEDALNALKALDKKFKQIGEQKKQSAAEQKMAAELNERAAFYKNGGR